MITLLARLAAADEAARQQPVASPRALDLLGWPRVLDQLARHCQNRLASDRLRRQLPYVDPQIIAELRGLADQWRGLREADREPPITDISGARDLLDRHSPRRLEGVDLVAIARLAEDLVQLQVRIVQRQEQAPGWAAAARELADLTPLATELRRCLDRDGQLLDSASPLLARLRRQARDLEQQVRQTVARAMAEAARRGWTTADEVTLRGDRFCVPLKAGEKRKLDGIVHDRSQTGQTIYVEPAATVHLANDLAEARLAMGSEESRILLELNQRVDHASLALAAGSELLLLADRVRASLRWRDEFGAQRPELAPGAVLRLCAARHPLLVEALRHAGVVPLDLELPPEARVLVISGPNAGGKSVAMKTVGVLVLLAQCGWDVPAREDSRLPLVRRLFVDLGDEQSIEDALSSFSARLTHLRHYLAEADADSLLLCDEIGSGTDPQEGTALALTVLARLAQRGALVLASTHFGLLKAAVHDHPAMLNAAMDYDEQSLAPMFTLRLGDPGASHAFDIAARVGLAPDLLAEARGLVGEERYQLEQLLRDLARRAGELARAEEAARDLEAGLGRRQQELDQRLAELEAELAEQRRTARARGEQLLREWRRKLEQAVREVKAQEGDREAVRQARRKLEDVQRGLPEAPPEAAGAPPDLAKGERVRVPHLGLQGRVTELRGDKVGLVADGLRLSVDRDAVERVDEPSPAAESAQQGLWTWDQGDAGIPPELDLRGLRADEAWDRLDRLLDRALPIGLDQLTVVHGVGTGRLRDQLLARLASDPRVQTFHPGGERQSNVGATVVHLR